MVNHLVFHGRMVEDAKCGQTNGGTDYANLRLAWNKKYKDKETKCFLECKAFGGTASFIQKFLGQKGQELIVEGELNTEEWEKEGQKRSKTVLLVSAAHFCGSKKDNGSDQGFPVNMTPVETDSLPF